MWHRGCWFVRELNPPCLEVALSRPDCSRAAETKRARLEELGTAVTLSRIDVGIATLFEADGVPLTTECLWNLASFLSGIVERGNGRRGSLRGPGRSARSATRSRGCWRLHARGDRRLAASAAATRSSSATTWRNALPSRTTPTCCHISDLHFAG